MHYNGGSDGPVGGADEDSRRKRDRGRAYPCPVPFHPFSVSQYPAGSPCQGADQREYDREYSWPRLGGNPCGLKGDGEPGRAGGGETRSRCKVQTESACHAPRCGEQRDVHLSDLKYLFPAADPGQRHRLPRAVRQREPDGDRRSGDRGDSGKYIGGGGVLQGDGQEAIIDIIVK